MSYFNTCQKCGNQCPSGKIFCQFCEGSSPNFVPQYPSFYKSPGQTKLQSTNTSENYKYGRPSVYRSPQWDENMQDTTYMRDPQEPIRQHLQDSYSEGLHNTNFYPDNHYRERMRNDSYCSSTQDFQRDDFLQRRTPDTYCNSSQDSLNTLFADSDYKHSRVQSSYPSLREPPSQSYPAIREYQDSSLPHLHHGSMEPLNQRNPGYNEYRYTNPQHHPYQSSIEYRGQKFCDFNQYEQLNPQSSYQSSMEPPSQRNLNLDDRMQFVRQSHPHLSEMRANDATRQGPYTSSTGVYSYSIELFKDRNGHQRNVSLELKHDLMELQCSNVRPLIVPTTNNISQSPGALYDFNSGATVRRMIPPQNTERFELNRVHFTVSRMKSSPNEQTITCEITFTYDHCYETLSPSHDTSDLTIENDRCKATHFISGITWGLKTLIRLETASNNENYLEHILNCISTPQKEKVGWIKWLRNKTLAGNIRFSIFGFYTSPNKQGNISEKVVNDFRLLHDPDTFQRQRQYDILSIETVPMNMMTYFSPLISLLQSLIEYPYEGSSFKSLANFIKVQFVDEMIQVARLIRNNKNPQNHLHFLRDMMKSDLLNPEYIEKFANKEASMKYISDEIERNIPEIKNVPPNITRDNSWLVCKILFPSGGLDQLKKQIEDCFHQKFLFGHHNQDSNSSFRRDEIEKPDKLIDYVKKFLHLKDLNANTKMVFYLYMEYTGGNQNSSANILFYENGILQKGDYPNLEDLADCPYQLSMAEATKDSITVEWKPPKSGDKHIRSYALQYRKVSRNKMESKTGSYSKSHDNSWINLMVNKLNTSFCIENLSSGKYECKVQAVYDNGIYGQFGEISTMQTRIALAEKLIDNMKPERDSNGCIATPRIYNLEFRMSTENKSSKRRSMEMEMKDSLRRRRTPGASSWKEEKTIIFLGVTGSGKTTLINGLMNYLLNVAWDDEFRFKIGESQNVSQAQSQTQLITKYHIPLLNGSRIDYPLNVIDTPGFCDTTGIERDQEILTQIEALFQKDVQTLDAVCVVIQSNMVRLTATQKYIFDSVLSIFGNDVKDNIFVLLTFADSAIPPTLNTLKEARVPFKGHFLFNNSSFFINNVENTDGFSRSFWRNGMNSFKTFFDNLEITSAISLKLTKDVLHDRKNLEVTLKSLQESVTIGLSKIDTLRQEEKILDQFEQEIRDNKNFSYNVKECTFTKVDTDPEQYVTNCTVCNRTCHDRCIYSNNEDKIKCSAIKNEQCTVCPGKCIWNKHTNNDFYFVIEEVTVTKEYDEMKKKLEVVKDGQAGKKQVVEKLEEEIQSLRRSVRNTIQEIKNIHERLDKIALRPISLATKDYIDFMISAEKAEAKDGFQGRIEQLTKIKEIGELNEKVKKECNLEDTLFSKGKIH